jgi:transcriptional regulator with XRE-family HTH domain
LDTIAYWILEKNAHPEQFRAQLNHITQDVIDLSLENGVCSMLIIKAENHPEAGMLKSHRYEVINGAIEFLEESEDGAVMIGRKIKDLRQKKEISQAQLASAIGVTPSTISQAENNAISLSLPALVRLSKALNVSMGEIFDEEPAKAPHFIFRAKNRGVNADKLKGITFDTLIPENEQDGVEAYVIRIAPGAETTSHFIASKGREFGYMLSGSLELEMKERTYTMNEGDAVSFSVEVPTTWRNNSEKIANLLWVVLG